MNNNHRPKEAWKRQRKLQEIYNQEEVPSIEEIYTKVKQIEYGKTNPTMQTLQARALISMYYLTACRVSEIVRSKKKDWDKEKKDYIFKGIKGVDLKTDVFQGMDVFYIRTKNRKHKKRKTKRQPIPIGFEYEHKLFMIIKEYTNKINEESLMFDFSDKRATQIMNDVFDWNVHFMRHVRCTHLITMYDFNEQALIKFMGWTDSRPAKAYMELSPKTILKEFYKGV